MQRLLTSTLLALLAAPLAAETSPATPAQDLNPLESPEDFLARHAGPDKELDPLELQAALAELELIVVVQRDLAGASDKLRALRDPMIRALASQPLSPAVFEAMRQTLLAQVQIEIARGNLETAQQAFDQTKPSSVDLRVAWNRLMEDPEVKALRSYVEAKRQGHAAQLPPSTRWLSEQPADSQIDESMLAALEDGDRNVIATVIDVLGIRAVPALTKAVLEKLDTFPVNKPDPLVLLVDIDPAGAAALMKAHLTEGGFLWKRRMVRGLDEGFWIADSGTSSARWLVPDALAVMESLVTDEEFATEVFSALPGPSTGVLSPLLMDSLESALASADPTRRQAATWAGISQELCRFVLPLLERALESPFEDVRVAAAKELAGLPWSNALAKHVDDESSDVRRAVTAMLRPRKVTRFLGEYEIKTERLTKVTLDDKGRALLLQLLRDPDSNVRLAAVKALDSWPYEVIQLELPTSGASASSTSGQRRVRAFPRDLGLLLSLAQDPKREIRKQLLTFARSLPASEGAQILTVLATDPDAVIASGAARLSPSFWFQVEPELAIRSPLTFLENNPDEMVTLAPLRDALNFLTQTTAGSDATIRWLLGQGSEALVVAFAKNFSGVLRPSALRATLSPDLFIELIRMLDGLEGQSLLRAMLEKAPERLASTLLEMAADPSFSPAVRTLSAVLAAPYSDTGWQELLLEGLHDPYWEAAEGVAESNWSILADRLYDLPEPVENAILLQAVLDPETQDAAIDLLFWGAPLSGEGRVEIAEAIKSRWFSGNHLGQHLDAIMVLIRDMATTPALRDDALLAAAIERPELEDFAVETLSKLRDPALLPLLAKVVYGPRGTEIWNYAVTIALPGYLTDESAELLLQAAEWAPAPRIRQMCLDSLESMRTYFLARDYWDRRRHLRCRRGAAAPRAALEGSVPTGRRRRDRGARAPQPPRDATSGRRITPPDGECSLVAEIAEGPKALGCLAACLERLVVGAPARALVVEQGLELGG